MIHMQLNKNHTLWSTNFFSNSSQDIFLIEKLFVGFQIVVKNQLQQQCKKAKLLLQLLYIEGGIQSIAKKSFIRTGMKSH